MKWFTLLCIAMLSVCGRGGAQPRNTGAAEYRKISAAQARTMMAESADYILLDVRTPDEFREKRIEGAVLIPHNEIAARAEKELPDKSAVILVYCRSGGRSQSAARELLRLGYVNVNDFGGITDWPYETTDG